MRTACKVDVSSVTSDVFWYVSLEFREASWLHTLSRMLVTAVDIALFPLPLDWPLWACKLCVASEPSPFPSSVNLEDFAGATP